MNSDLTIIIPTLSNVKGLKYLLNYFNNQPYKVVVVDNKKKNLGFAGGINKSAKNINTKWMLILNDDIEFYDDVSINQLIELAGNNKLDAVSPILINPNGEVENCGYMVLPVGRVELIKENYSLDPRRSLPSTPIGGGDDSFLIDGLTAACLLIRTSVFNKLGGFDKSFFAYLEDVDFFLRLASLAQDKSFDSARQNKSFGIAYDVKVLHNHMTTTKTMGNFKARQDMINWWRLYFKHKEKFKFNTAFIIERMRNFSGFLKASLRSIC